MSAPLLLAALALFPAADPKPLPDDGVEILRRSWSIGSTADYDVARFSPDGKRVVGLRILRVDISNSHGIQLDVPYLAELWEYDRVLGKKLDPVKPKVGAYLRPMLSATGGLVVCQLPATRRIQPLSVRVLTNRGTEAYRIDGYSSEDKLALVAFSPTDKYLVTWATGHKRVLVWDGKKGGQPTKIDRPEATKGELLAGFSGDETRLVLYDPDAGRLEVYDPATGKELAAHALPKQVIQRPHGLNPLLTADPRPGLAPAVSADGRYAILPSDGSGQEGYYFEAVIDLTTGAEVAFADGRPQFAHFTPDGKAVTGFRRPVVPPTPREVGPRFTPGPFTFPPAGLMYAGYLLPAWPLLRNLGVLVNLERLGLLPPVILGTGLDGLALLFPDPKARPPEPKPEPRAKPKPTRFVTKTLATGQEATTELPEFDAVSRTAERRFATDGRSYLDLETGTMLAVPKAVRKPPEAWAYPGSGPTFRPVADGTAVLAEVPADPSKPAKPKQPAFPPPPDRTTSLVLFPLAPAAKR